MGNEVVGSQITGVVNLAKKVSGVQFAALVNIADESDYPIGLLNLIKSGEYALGVQYDEVGTTAITLRTGSRFTYGIIGLGYNYRAHEKTLATIVGLGVHLFPRIHQVSSTFQKKYKHLFPYGYVTQVYIGVIDSIIIYRLSEGGVVARGWGMSQRPRIGKC